MARFRRSPRYTTALPAACRGAFYALKSDGSVITFAGTVDRLYQLNNTDFTWKPVSKVQALTSISNASPAVLTKNSHGYVASDPIVLSTSGALPQVHGRNGLLRHLRWINRERLRGFRDIGRHGDQYLERGIGHAFGNRDLFGVSATAQWQFAQFGNLVFATQANACFRCSTCRPRWRSPIAQGSPPQAAYISVVGRFLVLSGLLSNPYRIQWSGLNATTTWTSGVNSSDSQDFPDGGIVRGVAGGEYGIVFQDQAIRRMSYIPGSPLIFQIDRITQDKGLYAPYSIVRAGELIFFYAGQGFYKIPPGGYPEQIGREKVDRTFLADLDKGNLQLFMGAADPRSTRVYWAYKSVRHDRRL
jgi:hypothetical protein